MSEFVEYLHEEFGSIRSRRMFSGNGIYHDDLMFALIADDELYLKADNKSAEHFTNLELKQFECQKKDKSMKMSYFLAPEEIFEDPKLAKKWATLAFDAALRNKIKKPGKKTRQ